MKTSIIARTITAAFGLFLLQLTAPAFAQGIAIERVQRNFQARYHQIKGGYVEWPICNPANQTPAPHFPKDGFYGDLLQDSDKGVELVKDLVQKFYGTSTKVYPDFVKSSDNGYGGLEGVSDIVNLQEEDMEIVLDTEVTASNYVEKLRILETQMGKLNLVKVLAEQIVATNDTKMSSSAVNSIDNSSASCTVAANCAISGQSASPSTGWGYIKQYLWSNCTSSVWERSIPYEGEACLDFPSKIARVLEVTGQYEGTYPPTEPAVYRAVVRNTRGKIRADLSNYKKGTASIFLKLARVSCDDALEPCWDYEYELDFSCQTVFAQQAPTSAAENTFGKWTQGTLTLGTESTSEYVTYSDTAPAAMGNCDESEVTTLYGWVVNEAIVVVAPDFTTVPDPQDCCSPCNVCEPGELNASLQSIHVNIPLGSDNFGGSAGALTLSAELPSPTLATLSGLRYSVASTVEVVPEVSGRRQFKTSQALFDLQVNTSYKYTIAVYSAGNFGTTKVSGFYPPTGSASSTTVIENPDASPTVYNKLKITRTTGGNSVVSEYTYTAGTGLWELSNGSGLRKEARASVWNGSQTIRTETVTIKNSGNQVVYKEINTHQLFPWGQERVQQVVNPDGAALTSTWSFYENQATDGGNYSRLKQQVDAYGHWVRYEYDTYGRETKRVSQFQNTATGSAENVNRVVTTSYGTSDPQITTIESLLGQEIGRHYQVVHSGEVRNIVCQTPGATWNTAADNLTTITKKNTSGTFKGELQSVENPDGTMQLYSYDLNGAGTLRTNIVKSGVPNGGKTDITDGTKSITLIGSIGEVIWRTNIDIGSGIVLSSENYSYADALKRSYTVTYLDGTTESVSYACCGLDTTTDRDGVVTQYTFDALKRQVASTRLNITTTNVFDAVGNALKTIRIGSDSSQIVLRQAAYDLAGRLVMETNALNGATLHTNIVDGSGQTIKTNTYPDGGTRIETHAKDGSLLMVTGSAIQPVRYVYDVESDGGVYRAYTKEIKLNTSFADTTEWTKTYSDMLGRPYKTVYSAASGTPASQSFYNTVGQLWKTIDPDSVTNLFGYNARGEQEHSAIDLNNDGQINTNGTDRVTRTISDVSNNGSVSANVRRTRTYVWGTNSDSTATFISSAETSVDGLKSWNTVWNNGVGMTNKTQTVFAGSGNRYVTNTAPDGSLTISAYSNGRLVSVTRKDSGNNQIFKTTYGYDAHGRQSSLTDARSGTTSYSFNSADQVATLTTPAPGTGQAAQTTTTYFNNMLQATNVVQPDGTSVFTEYLVNGLVKKTYGSRIYPIGYSYDAQGRMKTMTNWSDFIGNNGKRVTTWDYDGYRGFLTNKVYDSSVAGPSYTYTTAGRLATRLWARGTNTTYAYNNAGDLSSVTYNDSTPGVTYTYDRRGRPATTIRNSITTTFTYNDASQLLTEAYTGGTLNGLTITNAYDTLLRRTAVGQSNQVSTLVKFGYDNASRLASVTNDVNTATYTYLANSPLVSQIMFKSSTTTRMTTSKQYDLLNRLQRISSAPGAAGVLPITFNYTYNNANQRTRRTDSDASYWVYQYDSLGQITSGKKYWSDSTPVPGQQFEYAHDDIGNRTSTKAGGDATGSSAVLRTASYTANTLNQYISRDVPNAFDVIGASHATNGVTVNGSAADYRRGEYFQELITVVNSSTSVWQSVSVVNTGGGPTNGNVFVPKTAETFSYDKDGNMTNDGRWTLTWDAENRLTQAESLSSGPTAAKRKVVWEYDSQGRRIRQTTYDGSSGSYVTTEDTKFISDGWRHLAELNAVNNALLRSYVWGLDLSGSTDGAGGVGGLLMINSVANSLHFYAMNGNGNVAALVKASDGTVSANYEYDPFGQTIRTTGTMASENRFCFSTKRTDRTTDFVLYEYRAYAPSTGRWLSRDPIHEDGGVNLNVFCGNDCVNYHDVLGLAWTVLRTGGNRAHAKPEAGDTVQGLAIALSLNPSEYRSWLKPVGPTRIPSSPTEAITSCAEFTVPNTVYVDLGNWNWADYSTAILTLTLNDTFVQKYQEKVEAWGNMLRDQYKLNLVVTKNVTGDQIRSHLKDSSIYMYLYAGHGSGNGVLNGDRGTTAWKYTNYGIAFMGLWACESAQWTGNKHNFTLNAWQWNVSPNGTFLGYLISPNKLSEDQSVTGPGVVPPPYIKLK